MTKKSTKPTRGLRTTNRMPDDDAMEAAIAAASVPTPSPLSARKLPVRCEHVSASCFFGRGIATATAARVTESTGIDHVVKHDGVAFVVTCQK